jgi:hypothetical protein
LAIPPTEIVGPLALSEMWLPKQSCHELQCSKILAFSAGHDDINGPISIPLAGYTDNLVRVNMLYSSFFFHVFWQQPCSNSFGYSSVTQLAPLCAVNTVLEEQSASGNNLSLTFLEKRFPINKMIRVRVKVSASGSHCHLGEEIGMYLFSKLER